MSTRSDKSTVVAGRKPILEALSSTDLTLESVYIRRDLKSSAAAEIKRACQRRGVPVKFVPVEKLDRLAGAAVHQGVVAVASPIEILGLEALLELIAPTWDDVARIKPFLVLPDRISDPHNLGAIVRSAAAFGVNGIILPERHSAPLSPTTIKASAGTALEMPFARIGNVAQAVRQLKERGYWIAGLAGEGSVTLATVDWNRPIVLIVGSEANGISQSVAKECDLIVSIPISPRVESLNAAVATGIALQAAASARPGWLDAAD